MPKQTKGEPARAPRIILENRLLPSAGKIRQSAAGIVDRSVGFGKRSPLTRKIMTFNLLALGMLVSGVLYLNQLQDGFISLRIQAMETDASILAETVRQSVANQPISTQNVELASETLASLAMVIDDDIRLYSSLGKYVGQDITASTPERAARAPIAGVAKPNAVVVILTEVWDRLEAKVTRRERSVELGPISELADPAGLLAVRTGQIESRQVQNRAGQSILVVAAPVQIFGATLGAVALVSRAGDIDILIDKEREQILEMFFLATLSTIILSYVLANTIVRPLRDLAEAARKGGAGGSRINPERIHIPDLTGRPDEIGYLSGAMQMMVEALYDRIEANEVFAADVSHEIKNPLTSLRSAVETLQYAKDDVARERLMAVIRSDVGRLDRLVTDISNASRLDSELVRDDRVAFDLAQLLRNLVEFNAGGAEQIGATLSADLPTTPVMVEGLEGRLAQVFVNLITNAISFSGEGKTIKVVAVADKDMVRVTVSDDGPGIPNSNLEDVFKRFYSQRPDGEFGAHSGLGLAISRQIVEAHGGQIWAENIRDEGAEDDSPAKGARFTVEMPFKDG